MSPSEILFKTADLIEPEGVWCQIHFALDKKGRAVEIASPSACKWCLTGALIKAGTADIVARFEDLERRDDRDEYAELIAARMVEIQRAKNFIRGVVGCSPTLWSDAFERMQFEVVNTIRLAASLAKSVEDHPAVEAAGE